MKSILDEIRILRNEENLNIDRNNTNRYRVIINEKDGTKTSYYFSTPIYNIHTKKVVDLKFRQEEDGIVLNGSNTQVVIKDTVLLNGLEGSCQITLDGNQQSIHEQRICYDRFVLLPTTNGVAYKGFTDGLQSIEFELEVNIPFLNVSSNNKCFALMKEKFLPFVTISCIGTLDETNQVIAPALIEYQKISDQKYRIIVSSCSQLGSSVLFEVNMYESKLIQDTTVESRNPEMNNAFGSTAFVGQTDEFGDQWLYSRVDFSMLSELIEKKINKLLFHLPIHNCTDIPIDSYKVVNRFCSFGSNWTNKMATSNFVSRSVLTKHYCSFDLSVFCGGTPKDYYIQPNGFVLKNANVSNQFVPVSTGDAYYYPQIIEINHK